MSKLIMRVNCIAAEVIEGPHAHELKTLVQCQHKETIDDLTAMVRETLETGGFKLHNVTFEIGE